MTRMAAKIRARGLTLAEVLATITIIAIAIPGVMRGISVATGLAGLTRQRAQASALAESKLSELVLTGEWKTGANSGDFAPQWPEYRWEASVSDWDEPGMVQIELRVDWISRGEARDVMLTTLVYDNSGGTGQ